MKLYAIRRLEDKSWFNHVTGNWEKELSPEALYDQYFYVAWELCHNSCNGFQITVVEFKLVEIETCLTGT